MHVRLRAACVHACMYACRYVCIYVCCNNLRVLQKTSEQVLDMLEDLKPPTTGGATHKCCPCAFWHGIHKPKAADLPEAQQFNLQSPYSHQEARLQHLSSKPTFITRHGVLQHIQERVAVRNETALDLLLAKLQTVSRASELLILLGVPCQDA